MYDILIAFVKTNASYCLSQYVSTRCILQLPRSSCLAELFLCVQLKGDGLEPLRGSDRHTAARRTWQLEMEMVGQWTAAIVTPNEGHELQQARHSKSSWIIFGPILLLLEDRRWTIQIIDFVPFTDACRVNHVFLLCSCVRLTLLLAFVLNMGPW